jgi:cobalamin biosynthesis protein CobD/CbiB
MRLTGCTQFDHQNDATLADERADAARLDAAPTISRRTSGLVPEALALAVLEAESCYSSLDDSRLSLLTWAPSCRGNVSALPS